MGVEVIMPPWVICLHVLFFHRIFAASSTHGSRSKLPSPQSLFTILRSSRSDLSLVMTSWSGTSSPFFCDCGSSRLRTLTVLDFSSSAPTTIQNQ